MKNKILNEINDFIPFDDYEKSDKEAMLYFLNNNDEVLTRDNKNGHITTSAWIVNKNKDKVLMIYHNIYDSWSWVGGHADGDGDILHVINKEIEEETGLTNLKLLQDGIYAINVVTVDHHIKRGEKVASHLHYDLCYLFEADENKDIRIKEDENSGIKWINIKDVFNEINEEKMKLVYKRLIDKLETIK